MLSGSLAIAELGSGRVRLPVEFVESNNVFYAQPVIVACEHDSSTSTFLCTATVASPAGSPAQSFDPSVQCGLHTSPLCYCQGDLLSAIVKPLSSKPVTATAVKVLVSTELSHSPVPAARLQQRLIQQNCTLHFSASVLCQVLEVSPVGPAATVYRVVPSTDVQLVTSSSCSSEQESRQATSSQQQVVGATTGHQTPRAAADTSKSSSASTTRSKTKSRSRLSSAPATTGASDVRSDKPKASSSSSKPKKKSSSKSEAGAIAVSASMFDVLDLVKDE